MLQSTWLHATVVRFVTNTAHRPGCAGFRRGHAECGVLESFHRKGEECPAAKRAGMILVMPNNNSSGTSTAPTTVHHPPSTVHGRPSIVHASQSLGQRCPASAIVVVCRRGFIGQLTAQPGLKTFWNDDPMVTLHPTPPPSSPPSLPFLALPCLAFPFLSFLFFSQRSASHRFSHSCRDLSMTT